MTEIRCQVWRFPRVLQRLAWTHALGRHPLLRHVCDAVMDGMDATSAAYEVGCENVSPIQSWI